MQSAKATQAIFPGAAVAQSALSVSLAGFSLPASHIAVTGAIKGGVVSMLATGTVTLDDWTLVTGKKRLMSGAKYTVGGNGTLIANGTGQPVGIAVSIETLSVTIQSGASTSTSTTSAATLTPTQFLTLLQQFRYVGSAAIGNATNVGTVTGLGLRFTPSRAILTLKKPSGGLNLTPHSVQGTFSSDGFSYTLSGLTDSASYILDYELSP